MHGVNDLLLSRFGMVSRTALLLTAVAAACLSSGASFAQAQVRVATGADATYANRYVWRGLTRTSHKVLQPEVYLAVAAGAGFITVGGWASLEPSFADVGQLSDTGVDEGGLGEFDYWLEYEHGFGVLDAAVGWTGYIFGGEAAAGGRTSDFNTGEVYGRVELRGRPVTPKLVVWYDVDNVDGAYLETSADLQVPLVPVASLYITALAGWSLGQDRRGGDPTSGYFAEDGLTHVDLSAWTSFTIGAGFSVAPALHVQFNRDPATKVTSARPDDSDRSTKVWFSLALSWYAELGAAR